MPDVLVMFKSLAWDVLFVGLASVGFLTCMYIAAVAFEPYYAQTRERIRGWFRISKRPPQLGYLPKRPRGDIEGLRQKIIEGRVR